MADPNNHDISEELKTALKTLVDKYEREDSWVRKQQIKSWKKLEEYWHGIQYIFWSEQRSDWVSPVGGLNQWDLSEQGREDSMGPFYDYVINIYKPHGESLIAALGAQPPVVRFPPDDADNEDDLLTSKTFNKISDLIDRHNSVKTLMYTSLFMLYNQGICFWYHAPKADKAFGITKIENFKKGLQCPECEESREVDDEEDLLAGLHKCPNCGAEMQVQNILDGMQESPKTRVIVDTYGGLHVKVPYWARTQGDYPYLIKALDQPLALLKSIYPWIADKIENDDTDAGQFERVARTPSTYSSFSRIDENRDLRTHRQIWLRPWSYEALPETMEKEKKQLYKKYPNGCYIAYVGKTYAESRDEDMDRYWTTCKAGLSTYIHSDPIGEPLRSIQEMRNALVNLTLQTIEQGIPSMFADPEVLNFPVYSKQEARPGIIYPAQPKPGQTLSTAFYTGDRATLSKEVQAFAQQLDKDGQFVVGDFPSLYGGAGDGKSRTLGEYQQSRQQALQRLSIVWALFCTSWSKLKERCVHMYVENMIDDEKYVVPDQQNKSNYVNVWIRRGELEGKVGEVEPEGADSFPISMPQKQALFFKLLETNDEFIKSALFDPENRRMIADLTGFTDLEIPGENQRLKQQCEISAMMKGQMVSVDPLVDDAGIHIETCKSFLVSPTGIDLRTTNPMAYMKIEQHIQAHMDAQQQLQLQQQSKQLADQLKLKQQVQAATPPPAPGQQPVPQQPQNQGPKQ